MAEWIVQTAGRKHPGTRFVAVRFGNVLGSHGSVVPIFREQIAARRADHGHPPGHDALLHDDPGGGAAGAPRRRHRRDGGEIFVLDMGEPVKIVDLARDMIRLSGFEPERDIAIEFTGLRPGEKLHEELVSDGEEPQPTAAQRINRAVRQRPLDPEWVESTLNSLEALVLAGDEANLAERVVDLIAAPGGEAATVGVDE